MNKEKRITYLFTTLCVFITAFIIYGLLGSIEPLINNNRFLTFLFFGCLAGFGFSMLLSTVILTGNFFAKKKLSFKIIAAILWPITISCAVFIGIFCYFPYQIYNTVKILKEKPNTDTT